MSNKAPCPKCGTENELSFGTCECSCCHQRYGRCKKCGEIFDASGGLSATCPDCRSEAAEADSDGTFVGWLDAKIMNSNHNLEMHLLRLFVALPLLKPLKLRRKGGFAWWFGTLWLTLYVGAVLALIAYYGLKAGGAHPDVCSGIMGWGTAFLLFLAPRLISLISKGGSLKVKITTIVVLVLDIVAIVLAYMFSLGPWVGENDNQTINASEQESAEGERPLDNSLVDENFKVVQVGSVTIMAENLRYNSRTSFNWAEAMNVSGEYLTKNNLNVDNPIQGLCPKGWHIPSKAEFFDAMEAFSTKKEKCYFDEGEEVCEMVSVFDSKYLKKMGFKPGEAYWTRTQLDCCDGPDYNAYAIQVEKTTISDVTNVPSPLKEDQLQVRCFKD